MKILEFKRAKMGKIAEFRPDFSNQAQGLKPWKKKMDVILCMDCPRNVTELRMFIDCVNYYCDMWPSHAHILKLLTDQFGLKTKAAIK